MTVHRLKLSSDDWDEREETSTQKQMKRDGATKLPAFDETT